MSPRSTAVQIDPEILLGRQPLFRGVAAATIARLAAAATRRPLARGERLFAQGSRPTGMYIVVHGRIKLIADRGTKSERLTGIVGAGRSLGEPVMFLDTPALVDAIAVEDSLVLHLPKAAVDQELEHNLSFARAMLRNLSQRVEGLVHELGQRASGTGRQRLLQYLARQAEPGHGGQVVRLPASKAQVASHLHVTPEHFSRLLRELARDGVIRVQGREIVLGRPASRVS
jgi:CRP-like cAMP-binding protein